MDHTFTDEAVDVEVFVLDPQGLSFAGFATVLAGDGPMLLFGLLLLMRAVDRLLLKHCNTQGQDHLIQTDAIHTLVPTAKDAAGYKLNIFTATSCNINNAEEKCMFHLLLKFNVME